MEEKQKNEQKPEFKGNLGFIWLVGILVILLGCTIGYVYRLEIELNTLKQEQKFIQQQQVIPTQNKEEQITNETKDEETINTEENSKKVVKVTSKDGKNTEKGYTLIFYGKDENNKTVWKYETKMGVHTELTTIEKLKVTDDRVYINENGTITVLNKETGKVIWQNNEYNGASSSFCFDENETLYIAGYYGPDLFIVNKNGKTIKTLEFGNKYMWPGNLKLVNSNKLEVNVTLVKLYTSEDATLDDAEKVTLVVDLNNYSIKEK